MAKSVIEEMKATLGPGLVASGTTHGNEWAEVDSKSVAKIATMLRDRASWLFDMPIDCTVVDELGVLPNRFRVVWHLYSTKFGHRLRLTTRVAEAHPETDSLTPIWPGMDWHEREAWDLYGVKFTGHPNLSRILMYEEFVGHPLRKDYPVDKRQPLVTMRPVRDVPTQRRPPPEMLNRP